MSRRAGLRRAAAGLVVLIAAALPLAGCGQTQATPRAQLAAYLTKVNVVERQLAPPLSVVTRTVDAYSRARRGGGGSAGGWRGPLGRSPPCRPAWP